MAMNTNVGYSVLVVAKFGGLASYMYVVTLVMAMNTSCTLKVQSSLLCVLFEDHSRYARQDNRFAYNFRVNVHSKFDRAI